MRWDRLRAFSRAEWVPTDRPRSMTSRIVIVAESDDEAVASSIVLDLSPWRPGQPAVLRHFLKVADDGVEEVVRIAGLNDYQVDIGAAGLGAGEQGQDRSVAGEAARCSRRWMCRGNVRVSPVWPRGSAERSWLAGTAASRVNRRAGLPVGVTERPVVVPLPSVVDAH